jgi:hypothetical protein
VIKPRDYPFKGTIGSAPQAYHATKRAIKRVTILHLKRNVGNPLYCSWLRGAPKYMFRRRHFLYCQKVRYKYNISVWQYKKKASDAPLHYQHRTKTNYLKFGFGAVLPMPLASAQF